MKRVTTIGVLIVLSAALLSGCATAHPIDPNMVSRPAPTCLTTTDRHTNIRIYDGFPDDFDEAVPTRCETAVSRHIAAELGVTAFYAPEKYVYQWRNDPWSTGTGLIGKSCVLNLSTTAAEREAGTYSADLSVRYSDDLNGPATVIEDGRQASVSNASIARIRQMIRQFQPSCDTLFTENDQPDPLSRT